MSRSVAIADLGYTSDYVANGSFAALKENVTYRAAPDFARLIRLQDFRNQWDEDAVYVDESSFNFLRKSVLYPGDIVIANVGAYAGTVFRVPDLGIPMTLGPNAVLLRVADGNDVDYVFHYLSSTAGWALLRSIVSGSAQPKFNKTDLRALEVPLPPLPIQRKIAAILSPYDDLIENNNRRIKILEELAQRIYREWFVDFRYPGHEHAPMVESELGLVPAGWEATTAAAFSEITVGGDWGIDEPSGDGWVQVACLRGADLPRLRCGDTSSVRLRWVSDGSLKKRRVGPRDVIVEGSGECGRALAVDETLERLVGHPVVYSNFCKRVRCQTSAQARYLARQFNSMVESGDMLQYRTGTTIPNLNFRALIGNRLLVRPPDAILSEFERLVVPMERVALIGRNRNLRATRDLLLSRLISGEIDLVDLDIVVQDLPV